LCQITDTEDQSNGRRIARIKSNQCLPIFHREHKPKGTPKTIAIKFDSGKDLHTPTNGRTRPNQYVPFLLRAYPRAAYDGIELAAKCWIIIMSGCPCNKLAHARPIKSTPSGGSSLQSGMLERTPDSSLDTFGPGPLTLIQLGGQPC
jgi:hypothetical protein